METKAVTSGSTGLPWACLAHAPQGPDVALHKRTASRLTKPSPLVTSVSSLWRGSSAPRCLPLP